MARSILLPLAILAAAVPGVWAQPAPDKAPPPPKGKPEGTPCEAPLERFKKKLERLPPEERERFRQNWEKWKKMSEPEREAFRQKMKAERDRARQVIDAAIADAGLSLDATQREVFARRYREERRKIEEEIKREVEKLRATKIGAALERLKAEFRSGAAAPSATPTPASTP